MHLERRQWRETAVPAGLTALAVLLAERWLGASPDGWGAPWPGLAMILGLLLAWGERRSRIVAIAAGGGLGILVAALLGGTAAPVAALRTLATLGADLVAFRQLGAGPRSADLFNRTNGLRRFAAAAAWAALAPALWGVWRGSWPHGLADFSASWLFLLLATPAVDLIARAWAPASDRPRAALSAETLLMVGLASVMTLAAFLLPLPFLALAAVAMVACGSGPSGAAAMTAIVAVVAARVNATGGPLAWGVLTPGMRFPVQQLLLACCFGAGLPLALLRERWRGEAVRVRGLTRRLSAVVENNGDVLFLLDDQGRWSFLNPAWQRLSGLPVEEGLGRSWLDQVDPEDREALARQVTSLLAGEVPSLHHTLRFQARTGLRWVELCLTPVTDAQGRVVEAAGSLRDVDERKRLEEHTLTARRAAEQRAREATLLASTDELTGIANRRAFLHQLDREIEAAIDYGWPLAVALFDVDHFKAVNDRFGHAVGDRVLQHIAARAVASVRGGDLVGRLGGEEFGILMPGSSAAEAEIVAERLRRAVQAAAVDGQALPSVTVSIGIAQREDQRVAEALIATADRALYCAKDEGRNRIRTAA